MTADFGGAAMLALPVPALMASDAWHALAIEVLIAVTALAVAGAAVAAARKFALHKGKGESPCIRIRC